MWVALCVSIGCISVPEEGERIVADTDGPGAGKASASGSDAGSTGGDDDGDGPGSGDPSGGSDPGHSSTPSTSSDPDSGSTSGDDGSGTGSFGETGHSSDSDPTAAGDTTGFDPNALSFQAEVFPLLDGRCADGNCHQDGGGAAGLNLDAENAYDNLLAYLSIQAPNVRLVKPGNVQASYLYHKLVGTFEEVGGYGELMPIDAPAISEADLAIIEQWIEDGAAP